MYTPSLWMQTLNFLQVCTTVATPFSWRSLLYHHDVDPGDGDARSAFLRITVAPFFLRRSICLSSSSYYRRRS